MSGFLCSLQVQAGCGEAALKAVIITKTGQYIKKGMKLRIHTLGCPPGNKTLAIKEIRPRRSIAGFINQNAASASPPVKTL
jgi:hypothetical protein